MEREPSHKIYTIYDVKAESYSTPFIQTTTGLALRFLENLVQDPNSSLYKYPEDYTLFKIGSWDERSAEIRMDNAPTSVAKALEYSKKIEEA